MFSPFLLKPFKKAIEKGLIPPNLNTIAGTWGAMHDTGELTYMNLVHMAGCDGTDADSLTTFEIEGRRQAMLAIEALRHYNPGCDGIRLRNFGMSIGIRDTRKVDCEYNMTLVSGRSTGGDRDSHAATRNMACCAVAGQGAGIAAALSVKSGKLFSEINVRDIQKELERQGARYH